MTKKNYKNALLGAFSDQGFMIFGFLMGLVLTPILLRQLNAQEYGINAIVTQLIVYVGILDFGITTAVNRQLSLNQTNTNEDAQVINKTISTGFFFLLAIALLIFVVGAVISAFAPLLFKIDQNIEQATKYFFLSTFALVALTFPMRSIQGLFFAHQKQWISSVISSLPGLIQLPLIVLFAYFKFGVWSFVLTNLVTSTLTVGLLILFLVKFYPNLSIRAKYFDKLLLKDYLQYGKKVFLISVCALIVYNTDRLLAGALISVAVVTAYSLTLRVPEMIFRLTGTFGRNIGPLLFSISDNTDKLKEEFKRLFILNALLTSCVLFLILALNKNFILIWIGPQYYVGNAVTLVHGLFLAIFAIGALNSHYFNITAKLNGLVILSVIEAILNFGFSVFFAKRYGVLGISLGSLVAVIFVIGYPYFQVSKAFNLNIKFFILHFLFPFIVAIVGGILIMKLNFQPTTWMQFFGWSLVLVIFTAIMFWILLPKVISVPLRGKLSGAISKLKNKSL